VLTVAKVTASAAGGYAQYLEGRSQAREAGDYYLSEAGERVEAPGRWILGEQGGEALGVDVERVVVAGDFRAVMSVRHPETGEMLRRVGGNGEAVCAIDATFSAPKSVSVVWALASPELRAEIESCQERAVDRAVAYATAQVEMTRRRLDQKTVVRERAVEVLASSWRHTTARAVAGRAPDPQLHSHTLIHGAIRSDGDLVAVDSRSWFVHQREIDAAYLSELAQGLERLGFAVERETGRRARYFELAGVPEGLRERFSGRHAQVHAAIQKRLDVKTTALEKTLKAGGTDAAIAAEQLEVLERSGRLLPGEERSVAMQSRASKDAVMATAGDLDRSWWQDAQPFAFDARTVEQLRHAGREIAPATAEELDARVLERLTEFEAVFTDRDVRAAAMVAGVGLDLDQALQSVDRLTEQGELVALADGRLTTRGHRAMEARTVARARAVAAGTAAPINAEAVEREIAVLADGLRERGFDLAGEQARAVRVACGAGQLSVIEGQAGTGKSTALTAIARAHEQAGQQIIVTSTAALAAERLADELIEAGVDAEGLSTAALERQIQSGSLPLNPSVTVIHDEAALASTREHDQILGAVETSGARLVLVGDPRQSRSVGASGLWERIEHAAREQDGYVQLQRIVRAQDPADRRDQALWRSGQHERALTGYSARGRLILEEDRQAVEDRALEAAHADREAGRGTLVVAQTSNEHLDALNARMQAIRGQAGELGDHEIPLVGRPYGLRAGDEVQIRHPVAHPDLGRVSNGTTGHVADVASDGMSARLTLADGREAIFPRELLDAAQTRLSYVQHPFPAQGVTTDTAHVIVGEHATAEGSYVALTRARASTHLYATPDPDLEPGAGREAVVAGLAERMGRTDPEIPSINLPLAHEQHVEVEHARESRRRPSPPPEEDQPQPQRRQPRAWDEVAELREERDRLTAVLQTYPVDVEQEICRLEGQAGQAHESAAGDRQRSEHWQGVYEQLGPLRRRSQDGRQARDHADLFAERAAEQQARGDQFADRARALASGPGSPGAWEWTHPDTRAQLYASETRLAAAVDQHTQARETRPGRRAGERWGEHARWLAGERDRLRGELRTYPHQQARDAQNAEQHADHDAHAATDARGRADRVGEEYEQLGRLARRGQRGTQAQERQHAFQEQADRHTERERSERERARQIREQPSGPVEWDRQHPGVRDRLAVYERAQEQAHLYTTQELVEHATGGRSPLAQRDPITRTLGSRPASGPRREAWDQGARAIAGYRDRYNVTDQQPGGVLGAEPRTPGRQHQEWAQARRLVREAREQLQIVDPTQARPAPAITPDRGRGPGFGM
jgi:conjugative relaxase-like TrwC/TraI family protein